jgi:ribosomal protein L37E
MSKNKNFEKKETNNAELQKSAGSGVDEMQENKQKQETPNAEAGAVSTENNYCVCNRCGHKFLKTNCKICPKCFAPLSWKR